MLSPRFLRVQFGLAIALPSAGLLGAASANASVIGQPEESTPAPASKVIKESVSPLPEALRPAASEVTAQLSVESVVAQPQLEPASERSSAPPIAVSSSEPVAQSTAIENAPSLASLTAAENIKPQSLKTSAPSFSQLVGQAPSDNTEAVMDADDAPSPDGLEEEEDDPDAAEMTTEATDSEDPLIEELLEPDSEAPSTEDSPDPEEDEVFSPLPEVDDSTAPDTIEDDLESLPEAGGEADEVSPEVLEPSTSDESEADIPIPDERVLDELQFLDPAPNPLLIQTTPEEVEIIGSQPLALEQALELAYRNNPDLRVVLLELEQSEAALREAQADNFPTVSVSGNLQGQNTLSNDGGGLTPTADGGFTFDTSTSEELGVSYSAQLDVVYNLFTSGGRQAQIEAAAEQVELALLEVERRREDLRLATANEYYDLQAAIESIRISQAFLEEAERNLQDTTLREEVGVGTRFDVLRAQVQVANARQDLVNAERSRQVAQRTLARRLNVPPSLTITTVPVDIAGTWPLDLEESIVLAYQNRAELEQQLTQRDVNEALRRAELSVLGPQVDLFANYSLSDVLNQEDSFSDNYAFGARVSWTLFEGGAARARARQRELDIEIAERNFEETRNTVRLGVESAYYNLQANQTNIETARLAVTQAQEALELAILRFDAGVGTQLDILNAQSELTDAEVNLVQAVIGYNRSLAEITRAVSNLPEPYYEEIPY